MDEKERPHFLPDVPPPPPPRTCSDGTPDVGALEDRMALFMRLHHRAMHRYFRSVGMFNGHPHMLFIIRHRPGITQKELAEVMEISPASVAISVRRSEEAGLIRRCRDERDGRVMHLYLTAEGERMDAACARGRDFLIAALYRDFTPEDRRALYALLEKMTNGLIAATADLPGVGDEEGRER